MIMIKIDTIGTTSLLSATTTTGSSVDDINDASTTAVAVCSTLTTAMPSGYAHAETTQRYIDSLSDEQLVEMERLLEEKESSMGITSNIEVKSPEKPKVYKKL